MKRKALIATPAITQHLQPISSEARPAATPLISFKVQQLALQVKSLTTTLGGFAKAVKAPKKVHQIGNAIAKLLDGENCLKKEWEYSENPT